MTSTVLFPDEVIFGVADGLFAQGAGRLCNAMNYLDVFEFMNQNKGPKLIPSGFGETVFLRPVRHNLGHEMLLAGSLGFARDAGGRAAFIGAGVLLERPLSSVEQLIAALQHTRALIEYFRTNLMIDRFTFGHRGEGFNLRWDRPLKNDKTRLQSLSSITDSFCVGSGDFSPDSREVATTLYLLANFQANRKRIIAAQPGVVPERLTVSLELIDQLQSDYTAEQCAIAEAARVAAEAERQRVETERARIAAQLPARVDTLERRVEHLTEQLALLNDLVQRQPRHTPTLRYASGFIEQPQPSIWSKFLTVRMLIWVFYGVFLILAVIVPLWFALWLSSDSSTSDTPKEATQDPVQKPTTPTSLDSK